MLIWIASYPRSGNTFFRVLLNNIFGIKTYSIYDDRFDIGADEKTSEAVGHQFLPDDFDLRKAREKDEVFYIKTHELLDDRIDTNDKVIYLIRDGRDSSLSFVKHQKRSLEKRKVTLSNVIEGKSFVDGWDWGWGEHVESWQANHRENTLLIRFEELIKEPLLCAEDVAIFINKEPISTTLPTFGELKEINPVFFRKGKTNSWEGNYSEEEHIAFWMKNYSQMTEYGYIHLMPKEMNGNTKLLRELSCQNTYVTKILLKELQGKELEITQKNKELQGKELEITQKNKELQGKDSEIVQHTQSIQKILLSKRYRLGSLIAAPYIYLKPKK